MPVCHLFINAAPASPSDDTTPLLKQPTELNRLGIEGRDNTSMVSEHHV